MTASSVVDRHRRQAERRADLSGGGSGQMGNGSLSTGRHCSRPSWIHAFEQLDIHQFVADLDVGVGTGGQKIDLSAFLDFFSGQGREPRLGGDRILGRRCAIPSVVQCGP